MNTDWRTLAACRPHVTSPETDLWHDVEHVGKGVYETKQDRAARVREAKAVCAGCPVKATCLAETTDDDHGIRGGLALTERSASRVCSDARGTVKGYQRHRRARDAVCTPCRDAWNAYQGERRGPGYVPRGAKGAA